MEQNLPLNTLQTLANEMFYFYIQCHVT